MSEDHPRPGRLSIVMVDIGVAFGGSIVSGATLCNGLSSLGHRVTLITAMPISEMQHVVGAGVDIRFLAQGVDYRAWATGLRDREARQPRWLRRLLRYPEVLLHLVVRNLPYSLRVASICRTLDADILHANNGPDLPTAIAAIISRRRSVMHLRGAHQPSAIAQLAVRATDRFIAISQYAFDECVKSGVPAARTQVLLNPVTGTDPLKDDVSRVRGELGAGAGDFLIGAVGRVVGFKGQRELLIAMAPLLRAHPDIKLAIVGDAADGDAGYLAGLRDWVRDNALESQVCFAGFRSDIDTVYAALDVMAHTSVHPEPFGRVIVEAMLQGCAVVASAYGGPLEIIQDGIDGVLLDPRDAPALTEGIRLLYLDRERTRRIAEAGKAMARERFGEAAYARATVSLYRQLLGRT